MWRTRRWRQLLDILEYLPRTSAYAQALATDEELAEEIAAVPEDDCQAVWSRSHRDYSSEVEMLTAVFDRLGELIRVTAAVRGARGKPPAPGPRPIYAVEKYRKRKKRMTHEQLVSRLIKKPAE
jgi:hypothetical protein